MSRPVLTAVAEEAIAQFLGKTQEQRDTQFRGGRLEDWELSAYTVSIAGKEKLQTAIEALTAQIEKQAQDNQERSIEEEQSSIN